MRATRDGPRAALPANPFVDARWHQIVVLSALLLWGVFQLDFDVTPARMAATFGAAFAVQALGSRFARIPFEWLSAAITALSLTLILRADSPWPYAAAAAIAIGAKFLIRIDGKHVFNPANIGIVVMILLTDAAWTTPGQWGTAAALALLMAIMGLVVVTRSSRADVPLVFFAAYAGLLFARAAWLGDPLAIPLHQLKNGVVLLFAFHMISDPKTTPDDLAARVAFVIATAALGYWMTHHMFIADGILYALAIMCVVRPALDALRPATRFTWRPTAPPEAEPAFIGAAADLPPPLSAPLAIRSSARRA